jgi:hypothetical protein
VRVGQVAIAVCQEVLVAFCYVPAELHACSILAVTATLQLIASAEQLQHKLLQQHLYHIHAYTFSEVLHRMIRKH